MLSNIGGSANNNKFYIIQLLHGDASYHLVTRWGRLGEFGKSKIQVIGEEEEAIKKFASQFKSKTKNAWGADPFVRHPDKYQLVETEEDGDGSGSGDAALGRLSKAQIERGQEVLGRIREALDRKGRAKVKREELTNLSSEFYSLIPTTSGRQKPPPIENIQILGEKESLLEFWLRMGFEDFGEEMSGSPIEGVREMPCPHTLTAAAKAVSDAYSIKSALDRGAALAKEQAGDPVQKMSVELYGSILLYTGNSIYSEINRCLRSDWKSVRKYWNYLRLYFEAIDSMPKRKVTLWRGIAVDLFDEYKEGKIITWWSISSCTADINVAKNFMSCLGGGAASLITLHCKTACDVSGLSFYPHERESLLQPGTKLKVLSRRKKGNIAEIEVEEV
uniref:NAD(P)(+)--arginine ADP-ribosyltransferase n=2 Tax=Ditylum brightwellii TaxID=49249 RepID=A0A7S4VUD4_9STRA